MKYRSISSKSTAIFQAIEPSENAVVAFLSLSGLGLRRPCVSTDLYVEPRFRRRGIATHLVDEARDFLEDGYTKMLIRGVEAEAEPFLISVGGTLQPGSDTAVANIPVRISLPFEDLRRALKNRGLTAYEITACYLPEFKLIVILDNDREFVLKIRPDQLCHPTHLARLIASELPE